MRDRGILVTATASTLGDSYRALAWGQKLVGAASADVAADVLLGRDEKLSSSERVVASWARRVVNEHNKTGAADVQDLRDAGYDDTEILAITLFVALRLAFSTVNDALGVRPDHELADTVPVEVRDAVTWGRPMVADSQIAD